MLVLARVLVCICEFFCLSESTLDHGCASLQYGGKEIQSRCGLFSQEYGRVGRVVFVGVGRGVLIADPLVCLGYQQASKG